MKKLLLLFALIFSAIAFSQELSNQESKDIIYDKTDVSAEYEGGMSSFRKEFSKNIKVNKIQGKGTYRTEITFIVERDGTISNIKARGENESFNEQAIKAIKKIKTKWSPGKYKGTPVRMYFRFPSTVNI